MYDIRYKNWYIVQTFSGFENQVIKSIKENIKLSNMEEFFDKMIIPSERVVEIKSGKKKISEQKFFPGYILIQMRMNEKSWHLIKNTQKVIGFIGGTSEKPSPMDNEEINKILQKINQTKKKLKPKIIFTPGEKIRVKSGPFADFNGTVETIDYEKHRLKVLVSIFGRSTPVELDFIQIQKNS